MRHLLFSSLFLLSISLQAETEIVGGKIVSQKNEANFMVNLGKCGGTIIGDHWILTAAHCKSRIKWIKAGDLNLTKEKLIVHPDYNSVTNENDFALIKIKENIQDYKDTLTIVKLASPRFEKDGHQDPGTMATVMGWGKTHENSTHYSNKLRKVEIPIVSNEIANAKSSYNGEVLDSMITAGYTKGGKASCEGDSGGPLLVYNEEKIPVQIGVVSWGEGCARPKKFDVYAKVSSAYTWIKKTISF